VQKHPQTTDHGAPPPYDRDKPIIALVGIPVEWLGWLERFAEHAGGISQGELIAVALTTLARRWKFEPPPAIDRGG